MGFQGEVGGAKLYRDLTELRGTDHEATKIVISEAKAAMHHATSTQLQNNQSTLFKCRKTA